MPIGVGIGGAVAGIGGAVIGAHSQSKAIDKANDQSQQNNAANIAFLNQQYGRNEAHLSPYEGIGMQAGNALGGLLLGDSFRPGAVPGTPAAGGGGALGAVPNTAWAEQAWQNIAPMIGPKRTRRALSISDPNQRIAYIEGDLHRDEARAYNAYVQSHPRNAAPTPAPAPTPVPGATPAPSNTASALSAWDQFRQGTNYNWRKNEGAATVNGALAQKGMFHSGAADRARIEYGQNFASNELSNYMNLLAGQQALGFSASSAIAGIGQNFAGQVVAGNNAASQNASNAALAQGNVTGNMWGGIGGALGQGLGVAFQSSYGQPHAYGNSSWYGSNPTAGPWGM